MWEVYTAYGILNAMWGAMRPPRKYVIDSNFLKTEMQSSRPLKKEKKESVDESYHVWRYNSSGLEMRLQIHSVGPIHEQPSSYSFKPHIRKVREQNL